MITQLSIKGFKTLKDFSVPLTRVSVLVGPNNCGKTNVLRALSFLGTAVREGLPTAILKAGGDSEVFCRAGDQHLEIALEARFGKTTVMYQIGTATPTRPHGIEDLSTEGEFQVRSSLGSDGSADIAVASDDRSRVSGLVPGNILRLFSQRLGCPEPLRRLHEYLGGVAMADFSMDRLRDKSRPAPGVPVQTLETWLLLGAQRFPHNKTANQFGTSGPERRQLKLALYGDERADRERRVSTALPIAQRLAVPALSSVSKSLADFARQLREARDAIRAALAAE